LVQVELQEKQPAQALHAVQEQIAKSPGTSGFYTLEAGLLLNAKDRAGAETAAQKAVELNPNDADAVLLLAGLQAQRGAVDQATATYRHGISRNPRDLRLKLALGSMLEGHGNWQEAQKLYQDALQIKPDDPSVANNLAYLMIEHGGDKNIALSLAQTARRGMPTLSNTADTLGWAYYYKGDFPSAVNTLQSVVKDAPDDPTYRYHLGLAYRKNGDDAQAKQEFTKALALHPDAPQAAEIRKALAE
jgi:Flp pilus assembly protein TadD